VPETPAGKQTCRSRQYRPIRLFQRRSMNLAPQDRHLVAHHDDLDGDIGVTAEDESDQLQDTTERSITERKGHGPMLAAHEANRQRARRRR